ncbi:MAG: 50S ribosomal protein L23 [Patescibacteria group bacterium]|nr:50S ribosomal protein L23 [Patescibacteria group bacterium]
MNISDILVRPIVTEKSLDEVKNDRYTFEVAKEATKDDVRKAVETVYDVKVLAVRTMINKGGMRRVGRKRLVVKESNWKKAIIQLAKGQKIAVFEIGVEK